MIEITDDIQRVVDSIANAYRDALRQEGKVASGNLVNFTTNIVQEGVWFSIVFNLPDYWKYVENGRAAGKFPPIDAIANWITVKPIIPRAINGRIPSTKQLAFLIARGIAKNGIKPTKVLQNTLKDGLVSDLEDQLCDLILSQIETEVEDAINEEIYN